jgi:hypothetical protein
MKKLERALTKSIKKSFTQMQTTNELSNLFLFIRLQVVVADYMFDGRLGNDLAALSVEPQ